MPSGRPNIVFVITDQQRYDTIAALGHEHADTPNLDRLVREGTSFVRTYVTAPSCAPSRASLFTGLYPHNTGVLRNDDPWSHSWVELLADAGYHCVNVGKMHTFPYDVPAGFHERHVVENKDRSNPKLPFLFDEWDKAFFANGLTKPDRASRYRALPDYQDRFGAFVWNDPERLHADRFVGGLARRWLDVYPGREPFFLQIGFPGPHPPYDPTAESLKRYNGRRMPDPQVTREELQSQPFALQELRRDHREIDHDGIVHHEHPTEHQSQQRRRHYMANVSMIDDEVGLLLDGLQRRGVADDTVIIFTSDHGDCLGDHGHSQKWSMYEPSVRVPAIAWGPEIAAGQIRDELVAHMDLGPTVLELAGIEPPAWMEAESLLPALQGSDWSGRNEVFSEHARDAILFATALMTMVRDDRYKLVEFVDHDDGQLFDLEVDPFEQHNLWNSDDHSGIRSRLARTTKRWRAESELRTAPWSAARR